MAPPMAAPTRAAMIGIGMILGSAGREEIFCLPLKISPRFLRCSQRGGPKWELWPACRFVAVGCPFCVLLDQSCPPETPRAGFSASSSWRCVRALLRRHRGVAEAGLPSRGSNCLRFPISDRRRVSLRASAEPESADPLHSPPRGHRARFEGRALRSSDSPHRPHRPLLKGR